SPDLTSERLVVFSWRAFFKHHADLRSAHPRSLRKMRLMPQSVSHRGLYRAVCFGCAALHLLSHHRVKRPDSPSPPSLGGKSYLWLRYLPGDLPVQCEGRSNGGKRLCASGRTLCSGSHSVAGVDSRRV